MKEPPRHSANPAGLVFDVAVVVVTLVVVAVGVTVGIFHWSVAWPSFGMFAGAPAEDAQMSSASIPRDNTLELVTGGVAQPLTAASDIRLGGNLVGRMSLAHPTGSRFVRDFDLSLDEAGLAKPVTSATVVATAHMVAMDMGTFHEVATPATAGHYRFTVPFPMSGEWQIDLQITTPTDRETVTLNLFIWT